MTIERTEELANFLRTRRERVTPAQVGLPSGRRRRTAGLRREEVAELAGISVTWYTWLEQARPIKVSTATMERIGLALQLDKDELTYLFELAQLPPPPIEQTASPEAANQLIEIAHTLTDSPAYVVGPRYDLLGWNQMAEIALGLGQFADSQPNLIRFIFTNEYYRKAWINWKDDALELLAMMRADYNQNIYDQKAYESLITELSAVSSEFCEGWNQHSVVSKSGWIRKMNHPIRGNLSLFATFLQMHGSSFPRLVVYSGYTENDRRLLKELRNSSKI
ncbi:MAG: helix-turn-helix transcriptional regulator [Candidatus Obscuribacterales bacterium]|nr:helix-turn-helix transcriptional regulator [Candidatus Obscuribacterales bacterium]